MLEKAKYDYITQQYYTHSFSFGKLVQAHIFQILLFSYWGVWGSLSKFVCSFKMMFLKKSIISISCKILMFKELRHTDYTNFKISKLYVTLFFEIDFYY